MPSTRDSVKLLVSYDPIPEKQQEYFQYVLGEFLPALQNLGLPTNEVWHTAYGDYPLRLLAFTAQDMDTLQGILANPVFLALENRLKNYVMNYQRRVVPRRERFQF